MGNRGYQVETREQVVIVIGGQILGEKVILELQNSGVKAFSIKTSHDLVEIEKYYDPDFCVIFWDEPTKFWLQGEGRELALKLYQKIESHETVLYVASHQDSTLNPHDLGTITKNIYYSDYLSQDLLHSSLLNGWQTELGNHHALTIPGDGLTEYSLLSLDNLALMIKLSILKRESNRGVEYHLGNPDTTSLMSLAYLIRSSLPFKVTLNFAPESPLPQKFSPELYASTHKLLGAPTLDNVETTLINYLSTHLPPLRQKTTPPPPKPVIPPMPSEPAPKKLTPLKVAEPVFVPIKQPKIRKPINWKQTLSKLRPPKRKKFHLGIVGRGILIGLALYLGTLAFAITTTYLSVRNLATTLKQKELPRTNYLSSITLNYLQANLIAFSTLPGLSNSVKVAELNDLLTAYSQGLLVLDSTQKLAQSLEKITSYVFGSTDLNLAQTLSFARLESEQLYQEVALLDGMVKDEPPSLLSEKYHPQYHDLVDQLAVFKRSIITAKAILSVTPDLIGLDGRRKYGVLFQNNMELRSTGGFIGSFAVMSFENGKLYDMPIYDVYDADGQLKGHVEPPAPIKDILGEANWYLRDSNFDPDFPTSARRAEWFMKKSLNLDLDGTIAVNVNTLTSLLRATGPLTIPDYNETITADNLYERAQYHAEVNFFPGSTQKKEFLSSVAGIIFQDIPDHSGTSSLALISALTDSIEEKNTLISLVNESSDHVFDLLGWTGKLVDLPCPTTQSCEKDYAMVVDNNFGVNKANYFIKRSLDETITLDKNLAVNHILGISYENTSTSTAWPAGAYKNYQRIYLPIGTNIARVRVGEKILAQNEYQITSYHNRLVLAYLLTVPIKSAVRVEIDYTSPQLSSDKELVYTWYWQKQPGTSSSDDLTVYLNYPLYLKPTVISPSAELATQQLKFSFQNDTDHRLTVKFQR